MPTFSATKSRPAPSTAEPMAATISSCTNRPIDDPVDDDELDLDEEDEVRPLFET